MGTTTSTHEPLERRQGTSFKRHASLRNTKGERRGSPRRMDRLRRSFRDSFRRRKDHVPESSKPHQWQADESAVRAGTCSFHVKYLGCVEVFESRGMQVCEEALKVLRNSRRRPVKSILYVSGDGLRVVEDETKGLIVDQTIEKVSFCAPDRNHEKGFSYICRDGTTRRWMCHGFLALKESGERLSHAVGCAFAACLERKQRRDKECSVTMNFDSSNSTFTRTGSFRQPSITERLQDKIQESGKPISEVPVATVAPVPAPTPQSVPPTPPPPKPVSNPHAIERPHATVSMLVRQGSFRGFQQLNQSSPFKRQLSLRLGDLPSNLERTRSMSLEGSSDSRQPPALIHLKTPVNNTLPPLQRGRLLSLPNELGVSPIPETSPQHDRTDPVSMMCQQLSQGLSLLSNNDDLLLSKTSQLNSGSNLLPKQLFPALSSETSANTSLSSSESAHTDSFLAKIDSMKYNNINNNNNNSNNRSGSPAINNSMVASWANVQPTPPATPPPSQQGGQQPPASPLPAVRDLPRPEQWLGKVSAGTLGASPTPPRRTPGLIHLRAHSLGSAESYYAHHNANGTAHTGGPDPFDAEWAAIASRNGESPPHGQRTNGPPPVRSTNPFLAGTSPTAAAPPPQAVKAFEVQM